MAVEYQKSYLDIEHDAKISVTGEFSLPELVDLITPPVGENAIGMKEGLQYKWNRITMVWEPVGGGVDAIEVSTAFDSSAITSQFLTATYPDQKKIIFTNLTDLPDNVMTVNQTTSGEWYANLYSNKLP
jgi:hypothetical protein